MFVVVVVEKYEKMCHISTGYDVTKLKQNIELFLPADVVIYLSLIDCHIEKRLFIRLTK